MSQPGLHDFSFQNGLWRVAHRKLKRRLVGDADWEAFEGSCSGWEILGGAANIDDHWFDDPSGPYRGASLRRLDPENGDWIIWWWDSRFDAPGSPVRGRLSGDCGQFFGEDLFDGRSIQVRYIWSRIDFASPRWEQAFSDDGGETWETNWIMDFSRIAGADSPREGKGVA